MTAAVQFKPTRIPHPRMSIRYTFAEAEAVITAKAGRDHGIRPDASSIFHANKSELSYPDVAAAALALVVGPTLNFLNAPRVYYRIPIATVRMTFVPARKFLAVRSTAVEHIYNLPEFS